MMHIVLWLWDGWRPVYSVEHVNAMVRMLQAYCLGSNAPRIICLTDKPDRYECESYMLPREPRFNPYSKPNCYRRLQIFDPSFQASLSISPGDYVVSIDLDTVITSDLWPLLLYKMESTFVATAGLHSKYNGAFWRFTAGYHADIWTEFDFNRSPEWLRKQRARGVASIGSDQAWLSHKILNAPTWNTTHGICFYTRHCKQIKYDEAVLWNFAGNIKPWSASVKINAPQLYQQYQRFL